MSIEKIEQELRDGLEGVTPGPWWPGHLADDSSSCNCTSILAENGRMGSIAQVTVDNGLRIEDGGNDGPPVEEAKRNLLHIARCSPENIRALLDELSQLREVERRAKEVIRPFADEASEDNGEYRIDWKHDDDREIVGSMFCDLTFGHFRAARDFYRALSEREGQDG